MKEKKREHRETREGKEKDKREREGGVLHTPITRPSSHCVCSGSADAPLEAEQTACISK